MNCVAYDNVSRNFSTISPTTTPVASRGIDCLLITRACLNRLTFLIHKLLPTFSSEEMDYISYLLEIRLLQSILQAVGHQSTVLLMVGWKVSLHFSKVLLHFSKVL